MNDLRKRVESTYDLDTADPAWVEMFETACSVQDTIRQLESLVKSDGLLSSGSKEQVRIHPAVIELRHERLAYSRLLAMLGLSDEQASVSNTARRTAQKRWAK